MDNAFNASSTAFNASSTAYTVPVYSTSASAAVTPTSPMPFPAQSMGYQPVIFMLSLMAFMSFLRQS